MAVLYVMFAVSVYKMNSNGKGIGIRRGNPFSLPMELPRNFEILSTAYRHEYKI